MRVAFVGKGGSGKSALAGIFARELARRGEEVLVLDSDPMPGLAFSIGVDATDAGIPDEAVEENPDQGPRYRLREGLTAEEAVERYAAIGPDGVRVLQFGKLRGHIAPFVPSQFAFRQIIRELPAGRWHIVGDLPGGTRQPFLGWGDYARTMLVVVEPSAKSLLSARRLARLALTENAPQVVAVANKVRGPRDAAHVAERSGLQIAAVVPYDEQFAEAERRGVPPIEHAPHSAAVQAVQSLVEWLSSEEARV